MIDYIKYFMLIFFYLLKINHYVKIIIKYFDEIIFLGNNMYIHYYMYN